MNFRASICLACFGVAVVQPVTAQWVRSGSNGSLGSLAATNQGDVLIPLPADGKLHYTSVLIGEQATVRFSRNALNTPVYLLATSNVVILGTIDVSGSDGGNDQVGIGGPGGFDGGMMGIGGPPGDGEGPGGGKGGYFEDPDRQPGGGSFATAGTGASGPLYGNRTLAPLIGGSGGGGMGDNPETSFAERGGGGGGGGALLIASDTRIALTGRILANGGIGYLRANGLVAGGGSGGAVRLVAPEISGTGFVDTSRVSVGADYGGGAGRIRVDAARAPTLIFHGIARFGGNFEVFPQVIPSLRVIEVAGQAIAANAASTVQISLSRNASPNQTVKLRATDFSGFVPITVAVIPEQGPSTRFVGEIQMGASTTADGTVNVVLTPGTVNRIQAWTQ